MVNEVIELVVVVRKYRSPKVTISKFHSHSGRLTLVAAIIVYTKNLQWAALREVTHEIVNYLVFALLASFESYF